MSEIWFGAGHPLGMKPSMMLIAFTLTVLQIMGGPSSAVSPGSVDPQPDTVESALATQLARDPDGQVVGNKIYYPDEVFVAVEAGTNSLSQCNAGQFCIWSYTGYSGSFIYKTGQNVTWAIETSLGSFYNNRALAARLYTNTGLSSTCYGPQASRSSVTASYNSAAKVYLSDTTSC